MDSCRLQPVGALLCQSSLTPASQTEQRHQVDMANVNQLLLAATPSLSLRHFADYQNIEVFCHQLSSFSWAN